MQWSSTLIFLFSALVVSKRLHRKSGRNSQLHTLLNLDVLLFVVLTKLWENLPQTDAYVSSLLPIWQPDIPEIVWKGGKKSGLKKSEFLRNLAQYAVQSVCLLSTKFSHCFPSNIRHIRNWLHGLLENVVWINTFVIWFVWLYIVSTVII